MNNPDMVIEHIVDESDFLIPCRKRFKKNVHYPSPFEGFQPKSIKWRSPLVHSPISPRIKNLHDFNDECTDSKEDTQENNDFPIGSQDTSYSSVNLNLTENSQKLTHLTSSSSTGKLTLPLCDQDYMDESGSFRKTIKHLDNMCDLEVWGVGNRQTSSQNFLNKNVARPIPLTLEYYTQLKNCQHKRYKNNSEYNEETKNGNATPTFEPVPKASENLSDSTNIYSNLLNVNSIFTSSQPSQYINPFQANAHSQSTSHHCCTKNCTMQPYVHPNEYQMTADYSNFRKVNDFYGVDNVHQEIDIPQYTLGANNSLNQTLTNLNKSHLLNKELTPSHFNTVYSDNDRHAWHPNVYINRQHPFRSELMYRHQQMLSPYSVPPGYRPSTEYRYPVPRYVNTDVHIKENHNNSLGEHNRFTNPKTTQDYHSEIDAVSQYCNNDYIQKLDEYFVNSRNDINQVRLVNHLQTNLCDLNKLCSGDNQKHHSNTFTHVNRHQNQSFDPQLNKNALLFGCNSKSQLDQTFVHSNSQTILQNNTEFGGISKSDISRMWQRPSKRQMFHNPPLNLTQNEKSSLVKTPNSNLMAMPTPQRKLSNFNSFEKRLNNVILPRNQSSTLSTTRSHPYDRRVVFNSNSYQPNDKELNRFMSSNDRNYTS